jgi:hypothetical protein
MAAMDGGWLPSVALHFVQRQAENPHGCGFSAAQGLSAPMLAAETPQALERIARFLAYAGVLVCDNLYGCAVVYWCLWRVCKNAPAFCF